MPEFEIEFFVRVHPFPVVDWNVHVLLKGQVIKTQFAPLGKIDFNLPECLFEYDPPIYLGDNKFRYTYSIEYRGDRLPSSHLRELIEKGWEFGWPKTMPDGRKSIADLIDFYIQCDGPEYLKQEGVREIEYYVVDGLYYEDWADGILEIIEAMGLVSSKGTIGQEQIERHLEENYS
jgi:hypothetical protein